MSELDKRNCHQGVNINTRREKHGDDKVAAKDVRFGAIPLSAEELNEFTGDKGTWNRWYVERKGKIPQPFLPLLQPTIWIMGKWRDSFATVYFGPKYEVSFENATIKRVELTRTEGGVTMMALTISCLKSDISGDFSKLDDFLDQDMSIEVKFGEMSDDEGDGEKAQGQLGMDHQSVVGKSESQAETTH
jgi:hypothetical protein